MKYLISILQLLTKTIRFSIFTLLLFFRPIANVFFGIVSGFSLLVFLFCLFFKREEQQVMWSMFGVGIGTTMLVLLYDSLLMLVAPDDFILITEL